MPLSTAEKSALQTDVQTLSTTINALVVDTGVNPLQAPLDAANVTIAAMQLAITNMKAAGQALKDEDATKVEGQAVLDAAGSF